MIHSNKSHINLDHLNAFVTVAEIGGVNSAAEVLFKSPSTISHALRKLQDRLGLVLFEQQGRKLVLTEVGVTVLKQAKIVLAEKQALLNIATHLQQDYRGEIKIAVDTICPHPLLLNALSKFTEQFPMCHIKLYEGVLSGAEEQLLNGKADVCIAYRIPQGFLGERFIEIPFIPVVHADHALAQQTSITSRTLMQHRQVVISDSGSRNTVDLGWLEAPLRWTVSNMYTAIEIVCSGMAFGWIPEHLINDKLVSGELLSLQMGFGGEKTAVLFLTLADESCITSRALADTLKNELRLREESR
jgi:DNA-binding transcriptional LysR family regulator